MKRKPKADLSAEYLRSRLDYDSESGVFTWRHRKPITKWDKFYNTRYAGKQAWSRRNDGYIEIRIDGTSYLAHRLAWLHYHGEWPQSDVDHKDRCTGNNAIANLRPATVSQNLQNASLRSNNKSGVKGVSFDNLANRWRAQICVNGKTIYIGLFDTIDAARTARLCAANNNFGEFATEGLRA